MSSKVFLRAVPEDVIDSDRNSFLRFIRAGFHTLTERFGRIFPFLLSISDVSQVGLA
jgi:hypothetical protein